MSTPEPAPAPWALRHKIYLALFVLIAGIVLGAIVYLPLSWGLMDDHRNVYYVKDLWKNQSLFQVLKAESMLWWYRPVYIFFVYTAYGLFQDSPKLFYAVNLFFVMGCCVPWALLLRRHVAPENRREATLLYAFLLLAATPMYNLVVYLSIQEKFVFLFGGLAILCLERAIEAPAGRPARWWALQAAGIAALLLGLWSKPTGLTYFPWLLVLLLTAPGIPPLRRALSVAAWVPAVALMVRSFRNSNDPYVDRYWENWGYKFTHPTNAVAAFTLLLGVTLAILLVRHRRAGGSFLRPPARLMWPLTLLAYIVLMIPWGLQTYNWTPAMVMIPGCMVLIVDAAVEALPLLRSRGYRLALPAAAVAAAVIVIGVAVPRLSRQSEITGVVAWLKERLPDPTVDIYVIEPASEASGALRMHSGDRQEFHYVMRNQPAPRNRPRAWLITRDEASISALHEKDFTKVIYRTPHWTIYER